MRLFRHFTLQTINNFCKKTTMALIEILKSLLKNKQVFSYTSKLNKTKIIGINPFILIVLIFFLTLTFFTISNVVSNKNIQNKNSIEDITKTNEFSNLTSFFISKINSPYKEIKYVIKNNDSIERILKKIDVRNKDIKIISTKLKQKKLSNIYAGRELNIVLKKLPNESHTVVNLIFPISNTSSIEVRKSDDEFIIKENILRLNKREVVVKAVINNNLYSSAVKKGIEPNIIVEFARIFGFEVDFQRDIRKGDWFEIFYEKFEDDNSKVRDTGKIIYASMYVLSLIHI